MYCVSHSAAYLEALYIMGVREFIETWHSSNVKVHTQSGILLLQETANHYQFAGPKWTNENKTEMSCKRHWGKTSLWIRWLLNSSWTERVYSLPDTNASLPDTRVHFSILLKLNIIEHFCKMEVVPCLIRTIYGPWSSFIYRYSGCFYGLTWFCKMLSILAVIQQST